MKEKINENCPCPAQCVRHGHCEECIEHHKKQGGLPYCERPENK